MEQTGGVNVGYLLIMGLNVCIFIGWPTLSIVALLSLRKRTLEQIAKAVWVLVIIAVPFLGPIAFWVVNPGTTSQTNVS